MPLTLADLTAAIEELSATADKLSNDIQKTQKSAVLQKITNVFLVIGVAAGIVLSGLDLYLFQQNSELRQLTTQVKQTTERTGNDVLCPLYQTFIAFEQRSVTSPNITDAERTERVKAYEVIHKGYTVLNCT